MGVLDRAAVFLPNTWSAFAIGQGKRMSGDLCFLLEFKTLSPWLFLSVLAFFRVEPLRCEILIIHAVEFFREELGSRVRTFLLESSGLLLLAHSRHIVTVGLSDREV